jgi:hypothetical protein
VGHLLFDGIVLPHQRGGWVGGHFGGAIGSIPTIHSR